jgi:hypothetical protein
MSIQMTWRGSETFPGVNVILSAAKDLKGSGRFFAALRMTSLVGAPESRQAIQ